MMSYMRSMGMMESSNLLGYFPMFSLFSIITAIVHEMFARLIGDSSVVIFAVGVRNFFLSLSLSHIERNNHL